MYDIVFCIIIGVLSAHVPISLQTTNIYICKTVGEHCGRLAASKLENLEQTLLFALGLHKVNQKAAHILLLQLLDQAHSTMCCIYRVTRKCKTLCEPEQADTGILCY